MDLATAVAASLAVLQCGHRCRAGNALFKAHFLRQTSFQATAPTASGETMNAQAAAKQASAPQTPSLPQAKPESIGLSGARLQKVSDAFKREVDKGTLPGATVLVARKGQI